ncbi:MAG TPA: hypothetical protein VNZ64_09625 [Candidatus Acidoferrum sp.]|nr:hypothetical protein [Candidatus Acidoferrum sp.]
MDFLEFRCASLGLFLPQNVCRNRNRAESPNDQQGAADALSLIGIYSVGKYQTNANS